MSTNNGTYCMMSPVHTQHSTSIRTYVTHVRTVLKYTLKYFYIFYYITASSSVVLAAHQTHPKSHDA